MKLRCLTCEETFAADEAKVLLDFPEHSEAELVLLLPCGCQATLDLADVLENDDQIAVEPVDEPAVDNGVEERP